MMKNPLQLNISLRVVVMSRNGLNLAVTDEASVLERLATVKSGRQWITVTRFLFQKFTWCATS